MYRIVRGYKEGRAVTCYDLADIEGKEVKTRINKEEVVQLCNNNMVCNTKIQWWEGKPIVRCSDTFEVVKLDTNGTVSGTVEPVKRKVKTEEKVVKAEVVAKLNTKRKERKESIAYGGYNRQLELEQCQLQNSINYSKIETIENLFRLIASEYNLKHTEDYLKQFAKKVNPDKKLNSMTKNMLLIIQDSINTYLMNMAYKEIKETSLKYMVRR